MININNNNEFNSYYLNIHKVSDINKNNSNNNNDYNLEILPKKGDLNTQYSIHLLYDCEKYPLQIKVDLEFFDPLTEKSLLIQMNYLNLSFTNCIDKVKLFKLIPLPDRIVQSLKTDYALLDYHVVITNDKGFKENFTQKNNQYKINKDNNDNVIPFDIHNNPVRDNKEKIDKYAKMNFVEKKALLKESIRNLTLEVNKDENLQTSILISQFILSTECEANLLFEEYEAQENKEAYNHHLTNLLFAAKNENLNFNLTSFLTTNEENNPTLSLQLLLESDFISARREQVSKILADDCTNTLVKILENSMSNLIENFQCDTVEKLIFNQTNPNNTIILTALSVLYPSFGNLFFSEDSFKNHFSMSNCLSTNGLYCF